MVEVGPVTILDFWRSDAIEHIILDPQYLRVFSCFFHRFFSRLRLVKSQDDWGGGTISPDSIIVHWHSDWFWSTASRMPTRSLEFDPRQPIRKSTRLLANSAAIAQKFDGVFCRCVVPHKTFQGSERPYKISKYCEQYPPELCFTLLTAFSEARWLVSPPVAGPENDRLGLNVLSHYSFLPILAAYLKHGLTGSPDKITVIFQIWPKSGLQVCTILFRPNSIELGLNPLIMSLSCLVETFAPSIALIKQWQTAQQSIPTFGQWMFHSLVVQRQHCHLKN